MVVRDTHSTPRHSSLNKPPTIELSGRELVTYYLQTYTFRRIPIESINTFLKPVVTWALLYGLTFLSLLSVLNLFSLNPLKIVIQVVAIVTISTVYGFGAGYFFKWLINRDTSLSSYVFVCLCSLVYTPVFHLMGYLITPMENAVQWFNCMASSFIIEFSLLSNYSFVDARASFIVRFVMIIVVFVFCGVVLPYTLILTK